MRVLIIENEIYLAQSIASKLENLGYECEIARSAMEAMKSEPEQRAKEGGKDVHFDVVLLSSAFAGDDTLKIIQKFKDSVVILLITYISNDTVSIPIKAGASDYIQKPFMIEELVRKIKHFEEFRRLQTFIKTYQDYLNYHFKAVSALNFDFKRIKLPLLIKCNKMINADNFVFEYAKALNLSFKYVPLEPGIDVEAVAAANPRTLLYFSNFTPRGQKSDRLSRRQTQAHRKLDKSERRDADGDAKYHKRREKFPNRRNFDDRRLHQAHHRKLSGQIPRHRA